MYKAQIIVAVTFGFATLLSSQGLADCVSLTKGPIVYDINACRQVNLKTDLDFKNEVYRNVLGLDKAKLTKFLSGYQGYLVQGKVIKSDAVQSGLDIKGALKGDEITSFLKAGTVDCAGIQSKRIAVKLEQACCNGGADVPCLLNTSYTINDIKVVGDAGTDAGDKKRRNARKNPEYTKAVKLYRAKKYKAAIGKFRPLFRADQLDALGMYLLADAHFHNQQCKQALRPLERIETMAKAGKVWADEQEVVRKATFLQARCYARDGNYGKAVIILDTYLIEPGKYRSEIQRSFKEAEFGYIHNTKEYREYEERAREALRKLR